MNIKTSIFLLLLIALTGCGFKAVDQNFLKEFKFVETNISGDKRISYLLRNKLKIENKNATKSLKINIIALKTKTIKEKNIQNEITKYEIKIDANVEYYVVEANKNGKFLISKKENYNVGSRYSETLNNEKKLTKTLVNDIKEQILKSLKLNLDEL